MRHIGGLKQERRGLILTVPKLQIVTQQQRRYNHLDDMARKPPAGTCMSPQPKLDCRLAGRNKLMPDFLPRLPTLVRLLPQLVEPQAVKLVWIGVEVGVKRDGIGRCQHQRTLW